MMSHPVGRQRLADVFEKLPLPTSNRDQPCFSSFLLEAGPHRLGKDTDGRPVLLVATASGGARSRPAPIELEHVRVQHDVRCLLWHSPAWSEEATFTLIHCQAGDRTLRDYFLGVVEGVLPLLGSSPSEGRVHEVIDALAELFRSLMMPARKSVQGLWAELFLIAEAADACALVAAWHVIPGEVYDFSASSQRLEVKSASGEERNHYFTLEQLHPPAGTRVLVASLFVKRAGGGQSLAELLDRVRPRVTGDPNLFLQVDRVVAASLGQSWRNALDDRFDCERAQESLHFYDAQSIPRIGQNLPPGVSDVRFKSDLTKATPLGIVALREAGGLFQAVLPLRVVRRV